jgi:hypothetical protein
LVDAALERGEFDLLGAVVEPLPVTVIADLLGVPEADRRLLRPWSSEICLMYELNPSPDYARRAVQASIEFGDYLRDLARTRSARPGTDLISALAQVVEAGVSLTEDELIGTCVLLLNAGHEASVNGAGNGWWALFRHPDQLARLRADRSLVPTAVEELLRFDSPVHLFERWVLEDADISPAHAATRARGGAAVEAHLHTARAEGVVCTRVASPRRCGVWRVGAHRHQRAVRQPIDLGLPRGVVVPVEARPAHPVVDGPPDVRALVLRDDVARAGVDPQALALVERRRGGSNPSAVGGTAAHHPVSPPGIGVPVAGHSRFELVGRPTPGSIRVREYRTRLSICPSRSSLTPPCPNRDHASDPIADS